MPKRPKRGIGPRADAKTSPSSVQYGYGSEVVEAYESRKAMGCSKELRSRHWRGCRLWMGGVGEGRVGRWAARG